jgi:dolichyl-phosphate beta-glucosyltransferase
MNTPDLSIVILAYQEEARIGQTLDELAAFLKSHNFGSVEVMLVCAVKPDGTHDKTLDIAESKRALFSNYQVVNSGKKEGKGRDARLGMLMAKGKYRIFMDADLATPLHHLDTAMALAKEGSQVVIAVRDLTASHTGLRKFISSFGNLLVQVVLLPGIKDTQCGFKLFEAAAAEEVFARQTIKGWGFDMEILAIARRLHYKISTVEAPDWSDVAGGTFQNVAVSGAAQTLKDLFNIKWGTLTGRYRDKHYTVDQAARHE